MGQQKLSMTGIIHSSFFLLSFSAFSMGCPSGWWELGGSCYMIYQSETTWHEGQAICWESGGYLAEIKSADEFLILQDSILMHDANYWIGLTDEATEGTWKWSESGIVASWTHWHSGEPDSYNGNEDCAAMINAYSYAWIDDSCDKHFHPLCEAVGNMEKQQENKDID